MEDDLERFLRALAGKLNELEERLFDAGIDPLNDKTGGAANSAAILHAAGCLKGIAWMLEIITTPKGDE